MPDINKQELLDNLKFTFAKDENGKTTRFASFAEGATKLHPYVEFLYNSVNATPEEQLPKLLEGKLPVRILRSAAFCADNANAQSVATYFKDLAENLNPDIKTCVPEIEDLAAMIKSQQGLGKWTGGKGPGAYSDAYAKEAGKGVA